MIIRSIASGCIAVILSYPLVVGGCGGSDCQSACQNLEQCPGGTNIIDCGNLCDDEQKLADDSGCESQLSTFMSCEASLSDTAICGKSSCTSSSDEHGKTATTCTGPCAKESEAFNTCKAKFCSEPANESECTFGL